MFSSVIPLNIDVSTVVPSVYFPGGNDCTVETEIDVLKQLQIKILFEYYTEALLNSQRCKEWFYKRRIDITDEVIKRFNLGFADTSICQFISRQYGRQSEVFRGNMQQLGLYKSTGFPFFHGDIVFPFKDYNGKLIAAYGRRLNHEYRLKKRYYRHWRIPGNPLFNLEALGSYQHVILCKTPLEAVCLYCLGIENVVSLMGLYSFDVEHLECFERKSITEVTLAFDNSDQGNHVSGLVAQSLEASNIDCTRLALPKNTDVNGFIQRYGEREASVAHLISNRFPVAQSYENLMRH